jgi:5'-nucleotidase
MIELFNALGYHFVTFGNHEFDYGKEILKQRMRDSNFCWISTTIQSEELEPYFLPYMTYNLNGHKVAFLGATTSTTPSITFAENVKDVVFQDPVPVLSSVVSKLRNDHDVKTVILISHLGLGTDQMVAERVKGINLILGGHTHSRLVDPLKVNDTWIMQAESSSKYIGLAKISFNEAGSITDFSSSLLEADHAKYAPDPKVLSIVNNYTEELNKRLNTIVGKAEDLFDKGFTGGNSPMGCISADSYREACGTEIGIINVGGVRKTLAAGDVTRRDLLLISPFSNTIVKMKMEGKQIRSLLENSLSGIWMDIPDDKRAEWKAAGKGNITGKVPGKRSIGYVVGAGLEYTYDCSLMPESRLVKVTINGQPLENNRLYSVATNNFLAFGGEGFSEFTQAKDVVETGIIDIKALEDYFKARDIVTIPPASGAHNLTIVTER